MKKLGMFLMVKWTFSTLIDIRNDFLTSVIYGKKHGNPFKIFIEIQAISKKYSKTELKMNLCGSIELSSTGGVSKLFWN